MENNLYLVVMIYENESLQNTNIYGVYITNVSSFSLLNVVRIVVLSHAADCQMYFLVK